MGLGVQGDMTGVGGHMHFDTQLHSQAVKYTQVPSLYCCVLRHATCILLYSETWLRQPPVGQF